RCTDDISPLSRHDALPIWQTYEIIRSYITNNNKPDEKMFIQEKGDAKLRERSILVGSGGSNFVGIYKIPSPVTVTSRIDAPDNRSEEHTSELQSRENLVCR